jgi:hypothetical protein
MRVVLGYRQEFQKIAICPNNFDVCITITEMNDAGDIAGTLELTSYPENLIELGKSIIAAAVIAQEQLEKKQPFTKEADECLQASIAGF